MSLLLVTRAELLMAGPALAQPAEPSLRADPCDFDRAPGSAVPARRAVQRARPARVPDRFQQVLPKALIPRPKQIHAMAQEGATMVPAAAALRRHYGDVRCPSIVMTGAADRIVDSEDHSVRLAQELGDAELQIVPRAGHMLHHAVPLEVAEAVTRVATGE